MSHKDTRTNIIAKIGEVRASEKVTKAKLAELSREILQYVIIDDSADIDVVNRLIAVLTPVNKKVAIEFFRYHLPWNFDNEEKRFGKKTKGEKIRVEKRARVDEFIINEANTIWTWAENHIQVEKKEINYADRVTTAVKRALEKGHLSKDQVLDAMVKGGIEARDIVDMLEDMRINREQREKQNDDALLLEAA